MSRRVALFLIALVLFLTGYVSSSYKLVVYNHSGMVIEHLNIQSPQLNRDITSIKDNAVLHFSVVAPFKKRVKINIKTQDEIHTVIFEVQHPFSGEKYNQVEIGAGGVMKFGQLGIDRK